MGSLPDSYRLASHTTVGRAKHLEGQRPRRPRLGRSRRAARARPSPTRSMRMCETDRQGRRFMRLAVDGLEGVLRIAASLGFFARGGALSRAARELSDLARATLENADTRVVVDLTQLPMSA